MKFKKARQQHGHANLDGRGTREAGAKGKVAGKIRLIPCYGIAAIFEHLGNPQRVVGPTVVGDKLIHISGHHTGNPLARENDFGVHALAAVGGDSEVDGCGENHTVIVVGVVAEKFDATGCERGGRLHGPLATRLPARRQ